MSPEYYIEATLDFSKQKDVYDVVQEVHYCPKGIAVIEDSGITIYPYAR